MLSNKFNICFSFSFLIQGSAADLAKTGLLISEEKLAKAGVESKLVMMIHDEMVWQVGEGMVDTAASIVRECLQTCGQVTTSEGVRRCLDMKVKISVGSTWGKLTPYE